ncbi:hypothetical protein FB45DRAFT_709984, partial [Roridomyces roridus]
LLFIGVQLEDSDIPHRTKLNELICARFKTEYNAMLLDIDNALGRFSCTDDVWTRANQESYLAITAHYMAKD